MNFWVDLELPTGVLVKGGIPTSQAPADLVSDMAEIDLPDGTTLDAGWVPEHDPAGSYRLTIYRDYWADKVEEPLHFESPAALVSAIQKIVIGRSSRRASR